MKLEKLPSGSYRAKKYVNGKTYRVTFDHKPTDAEVVMELSKLIGSDDVLNHGTKLTFKIAADKYNASKSNTLSPRTLKEYIDMPKRFSESFVKLPIDKITQLDIQNEINRMCEDKSPKTVRNYHAYMASVIKMFRPKFDIDTTLPQVEIKEPYIPSTEEVQSVLQYVKEHYPIYYDMFVLGCLGLRRSEICAIQSDQISNIDNKYYLTIDRAKVLNKDKQWVIKVTKTPESARRIKIPCDVALSILDKGYAFNGYPNDNYKILKKSCAKLGIPVFSIHKLRHYFASELIAKNVDLASVAYNGGWKSFSMLEKRYGHKFRDNADNAMDTIGTIVHEMSTQSSEGA